MPSRSSASPASWTSPLSEADDTCAIDILAEGDEHRGDDALGVEPSFGIHRGGLVLLDEAVGKRERPDLQAAVEKAFARQSVQHEGAEPPARSLLDSDEHPVVLRQTAHKVQVERLGESRIGDGGGQAEACKLVCRLEAFRKPRAE